MSGWGTAGFRAMLGIAAAGALGAAPAPAQTERVAIVLGTATPGGGFPVYGDAFVAAVGAIDPDLVVTARNTKGSAENIPLLESGGLDIGLVQGEAAAEAFAGIGRPPTALKVIAAMYSTPGMFVVRADSPVRSIDDLRGRRIALGAAGSGLVILARTILDGIGLDPDKDLEPITLERAGDGPAMVLDGRVAALWGGGIGWPGFSAMANAPAGARFIVPSEPEIARIVARNPSLVRLTVPAGTYRGQTEPLVSVGSWSLVLARPDLDESVGYRLARALDRGRDILARLPQAAETTAANTARAVPAERLHSGAARYLREAGYLAR